MFKNYLKTSLRFLRRNKGFTLINVVGLSIGTFCCLYILLYVRDQFSYDRGFTRSGDMYRVVSQVGETRSGSPRMQATTTPPVGPALAADFQDALVSTRVAPTIGSEQHVIRYNNDQKEFYEKNAYLVDPNFFELFDFHFITGSADSAFNVPNSVVLSKEVADRLFVKTDPLGKIVEISDGYGDNYFVVTGVVDETIDESSIQAGVFIRMDPGDFGFLRDNTWVGHNMIYTFVKLKPDVEARDIEQKLPAFLTKHTGGLSGNSAVRQALHLQPIREIHTSGEYEGEMGKTVSGFFLDLLLGIAILIQLLASINFMNLSTARASKRAKEVGVRKIIGADKNGLILQFLVESCVLSVLAVLISLPLLAALLPWLNEITGAYIQRTIFVDPAVWLLLAVVGSLTGILAGSYPAFYLSAFQSTKVLKGDFSNSISVGNLRRSLVVFQFVLSIVLISAAVIIRRQLDYVQSRDLGFSKDEQIVLDFYTDVSKKCAVWFALGLRSLPEVSEVSQTDNYPGGFHYLDEHIYLPDGGAGTSVAVQVLSSDEKFLKTLGIPLLCGRDFQPHDTGWVIINQTLATQLGLDLNKAPGTALFTVTGGRYKIAGVLKDFNYQSLHDQISPFMLVYKMNRFDFNHVIVKASSPHYASLIRNMERLWKNRVFVEPFRYTFLSEDVRKMYEAEFIMSRIITSFTVFAILISCLGLFGLAAFSAEQRTKEIGIRKIMGASVLRIVRLLSMDFFMLICLSFLLAVPITWWIMSRWLNVFAYRIQISWWMFALSGGATIAIAMTVVSFQAAKAAVVNPVNSLRSE
jgi:putative ABC transport system permease protein